MTTFGYEAEFANNAQGVIGALHDSGLAGMRTLHGYHCDCEYCGFMNGWKFRGQTDSSCSGEIISDVFSTDQRPENELANGMQPFSHVGFAGCGDDLCSAAIDVDAEPGPTSGLHVHVGVNGQDAMHLSDVLWQFARWEPVLSRIAGGRWAEQRNGMNRTVRDCLAANFYDACHGQPGLGNRQMTSRNIARMEELAATGAIFMPSIKHNMLGVHQRSDRHSNLNILPRRLPTWEFRLWNSTRAPWRIEMFCALSVALTQPGVVANLTELEPPLRRNRSSAGIDSIATAVDDAGYGILGEQLMRQAAYLDTRAENAPSILTAL